MSHLFINKYSIYFSELFIPVLLLDFTNSFPRSRVVRSHNGWNPICCNFKVSCISIQASFGAIQSTASCPKFPTIIQP